MLWISSSHFDAIDGCTAEYEENADNDLTFGSLTRILAAHRNDDIEAFKFVVVYRDNINEPDVEQEHSHEEADTLIPHPVLSSITEKLTLTERYMY